MVPWGTSLRIRMTLERLARGLKAPEALTFVTITMSRFFAIAKHISFWLCLLLLGLTILAVFPSGKTRVQASCFTQLNLEWM